MQYILEDEIMEKHMNVEWDSLDADVFSMCTLDFTVAIMLVT